MIKWLVVLLIVLVTPFVFLFSWMAEQKHALSMAWLNSFAEMPRQIRLTLQKGGL